LVQALRHKPEGRGSLEISFRPNYGPGVDQKMSTKNISCGGKGGRCVGLMTLQPSCTDFHELWEPQPAGTLKVCVSPVIVCFSFAFTAWGPWEEGIEREVKGKTFVPDRDSI